MLRERRHGAGWRALATALLLLAGLCRAQNPPAAQGDVTFGTTVVIPSGLRGEIYFISPGTSYLPKFEKMRPVGAIYTTSLNVPPRDFAAGFPGVTTRTEWFAIDYRGRFWIDKPGKYRFRLESDDGSKLYIDERLLIDNDGVHSPLAETGAVELAGGSHDIRVSYFQGPRYAVALVLSIARPGEHWRIFSTDEFKPPPNPDNWKYDDADALLKPGVSRTNLRDATEDKAALAVLGADPRPHDFDLRLEVVHLRYDGGRWQSVLVVEASGAALSPVANPNGQAGAVNLLLLARLKNADGEVVDRFRVNAPSRPKGVKGPANPAEPIRYSHPLALAAGSYTVEAAMIDQDNQRSSAAVAAFDTPPPHTGVGLSSVILVERMEAAGRPAEESDPLVYQGKPVAPLLTPTLQPEDRPAVYFVVYPDTANSAKAQVQVEFLVNGHSLARSVAELPPADVYGANPVLVEAAMRPGACELRITAIQGADSVTGSVHYVVAGAPPQPPK